VTNPEAPSEEFVEHDLPVFSDEGAEDFGQAYAHPLPTTLEPRPFKPWHRPRKQFVRRKQWVDLFARLLDDLPKRSDDNAYASYIGLPGSDLLDVRMFADKCASRGLQLRYLGFDRTAAEDSVESAYLYLSRDELWKSGNVHRESLVMPDDVSQLGNVRSLAYSTANRLSFDVVNLDLCGSATNEPGGEVNTLYEALMNLMRVQSKREEPWLLLFTATFSRENQSDSGVANAGRLMRSLRDRLDGCVDAMNAARETIWLGQDGSFPDVDSCDPYTYSRLLVLSFVTWLCGVGRKIRSSRFELASVQGYRINAYHLTPNMFSFAIRVTPQEPVVQDEACLLPPPKPIDECAELTQHVDRLGRVVDVDRVLHQDNDLFEQMRNDMANFLVGLRYDRQAYLSSDYSKRLELAPDNGVRTEVPNQAQPPLHEQVSGVGNRTRVIVDPD